MQSIERSARERDMTQAKYAIPDNADQKKAKPSFWSDYDGFWTAITWGGALCLGMLIMLGHKLGWF